MNAAADASIDLPAPVSGQRRDFDSPPGRLTYYSAGAGDAGAPPLLLIPSINAAGL